MNLMTVRSLLDELEKIAVSAEWIENRARRGTLQRLTVGLDEKTKNILEEASGGIFKTRQGRARGTNMPRLENSKKQSTHKKLEAFDRGLEVGRDKYVDGKRLKTVGPSFAQKHWKKGVAGLAATGLAAGAYALHKKRKSNREKTAESEEGYGTRAKNYVKGIGSNLARAASDLTRPLHNAKAELGRMKTDIHSAIHGHEGGKPLTGMQRAGKLTNHGLTAAFTVPAAAAALKKDPSGQTSRAERVSRFVGSTIGNLATSRRGISGSIAGSIAGDQAGKLVGKGINKVTGFKPKKTEQEATK